MKSLPILLATFCFGLGSIAARADDSTFQDGGKVSAFADKQFDVKTANGFGNLAPGFDKAYNAPGGASDLIQKTANLGGRDIFEPTLDFNKTYATGDAKGFDKNSPLGTQTSSLGDRRSSLPMEAKLEKFDHVFDDKEYRGREADRIRDAIDQMQTKSQSALAQQMSGQATPGAESKQEAALGGPRRVTPTIDIQDVKLLINKDVAPSSSWTAQVPVAPSEHVSGTVTDIAAPVPQPPSADAAPSSEALKR